MAGGLKSFLMGSLRFVMNKGVIGLAKHAAQLENLTGNDKAATRSTKTSHTNSDEISIESLRPVAPLNPAAKEFMPLSHGHSYILTSNINSLYEPQNQEYLHYNSELGGNISTDDGYMHNPMIYNSAITSEHNLKTRDPMNEHYLSASECSPVFDPSFCGDPSSDTVTDTSQVIPVFPIQQSNLPVTNSNNQLHSLNGGNDPVMNEIENMKLPSCGKNAAAVGTLEVPRASFVTESSKGASNKLGSVKYNNNNNNKKHENKQCSLLRTIAVQVRRNTVLFNWLKTLHMRPEM